MLLTLYRLMARIGEPAVPLLLARRLARGKEDRARLAERHGIAALARPDGRLIWIHGASVGESLSALPLIERLVETDPHCHVLITSVTLASARILEARLPPRTAHQFVPVDAPRAVERFLDHWRPDAALWIESELWPNLIVACRRRAIPMALINARMSKRSFRHWRRVPGLIGALLAAFGTTLAQSEADAARFTALGAREVQVVGDLKAAAAPLGADEGALERLRRAIGGRPVLVAASTHTGEEALVARVHAQARQRHETLLTVIVPRHAVRGEAIATEIAEMGLTVARRARNQMPTPETDVFLGDSMGEMGLYLRLASLVFIGKSLLHEGGHNPREPARLGRPVLFGPHMENFAGAAAGLVQAGGGREVADEAGLLAAVVHLLDRPAQIVDMGQRAAERAGGDAQGVIEATVEALRPVLEPQGRARA